MGFFRTPKGRIEMAGKTQYKNQWQSENKDRISLVVDKGKKDIITAHATTKSESLNGFIIRAINETIERDNGGGDRL